MNDKKVNEEIKLLKMQMNNINEKLDLIMRHIEILTKKEIKLINNTTNLLFELFKKNQNG